MNSTPRLTLTRVIAERGREICDQPERLEALLRDLCGAYKREINVLVGALEERVAVDLMSSARRVPRETLLASLAQRLHDARAYTTEAARWAVDSWAVALGVLTEDEFARRESAAKQKGNPAPPARPAPPTQPSRAATPPPPLAPPTQPPPTAQGTRRAPNVPAKPPARVAPPPAPSPTTRSTTRHQPVVPQPRATVTNAPAANHLVQAQTAAPPKRRFLTLRGCFVTILLLIVIVVGAVFVVPPIIMLLREEQTRPSINDTRGR